MWDAWSAANTKGYFPKYIAFFVYLISCLVAVVALNRLFGLAGPGLIVAFLLAAGGLLWFAFLPLFKRLHASPQE